MYNYVFLHFCCMYSCIVIMYSLCIIVLLLCILVLLSCTLVLLLRIIVLLLCIIVGSKRIKKLTNQLDDLTQKVVSISLEVRKNPQNQEARQQLIELRKVWAEKVKALTAAIDEIVNVEDFTAATGGVYKVGNPFILLIHMLI